MLYFRYYILYYIYYIYTYTGSAVIPCCALSQASCRSPDDRKGVALTLEDVGEHVGVNHMQKISRKGGNGNHSSQMSRGSGAL